MDRRRFLATTSCLAATSATASAQPASAVETAVRQVIQRYGDGREAREAKGMEPLLTPDADQLVSDGSVTATTTDL